MTTIKYADGTTEEFARVIMDDGFVFCYERRDTGLIEEFKAYRA